MFKSGFWFNFCGTLASVQWQLCPVLDYFVLSCTLYMYVLQICLLLQSIVQNKWQIVDSHSKQWFLKLWGGFMITKSCKFSIASTFFPQNPVIYLSSNNKNPIQLFFRLQNGFIFSVIWLVRTCASYNVIGCSNWCDLKLKMVRFRVKKMRFRN